MAAYFISSLLVYVWCTVRNESHYIVCVCVYIYIYIHIYMVHSITTRESSLRYFVCRLRLLTVLRCFVRYMRAELCTEGMEVVVRSARVEEIPKE